MLHGCFVPAARFIDLGEYLRDARILYNRKRDKVTLEVIQPLG